MVFWKRADILSPYADQITIDVLEAIRSERQAVLDRPCWEALRAAFEELPDFADRCALECELARDVVRVGMESDLSEAQHQALDVALRELIPWRKGPFNICGKPIDAEWRSNLKWDRIAPHLGSLKSKRVVDVGCGNGYYMFRAAALEPECVIGLDPSEKFFYAFELLQRFIRRPELQIELLGVEDMQLFSGFFDVLLCMGVLYHQRDPLTMLSNLRSALRPGGTAIIESQAIEGQQSVALCPPGRYAKMRNAYFIPTAPCLLSWVERAGFSNAEIISVSRTTSDEQRKTELMPFESLSDFLDSTDPLKTIEGHPAPIRVAIKAVCPQ